MTDSAWIKGASGLWRSVDLVARRKRLAQAAKDRIAGIDARFEVVMLRNGWQRLNAGRRPWFRP